MESRDRAAVAFSIRLIGPIGRISLIRNQSAALSRDSALSVYALPTAAI